MISLSTELTLAISYHKVYSFAISPEINYYLKKLKNPESHPIIFTGNFPESKGSWY